VKLIASHTLRSMLRERNSGRMLDLARDLTNGPALGASLRAAKEAWIVKDFRSMRKGLRHLPTRHSSCRDAAAQNVSETCKIVRILSRRRLTDRQAF
jgi:hypothetical protein